MNIIKACLLLIVVAASAGVASCHSSGGTAMNGDPCVSTADCFFDDEASPSAVLTCSRLDRVCRPATELTLGESCTDDVQCQSRICDPNTGYCTKPCSGGSLCEPKSALTVCTKPTSLDKQVCRPLCETDQDCKVFKRTSEDATMTCQTTASPGLSEARICLP